MVGPKMIRRSLGRAVALALAAAIATGSSPAAAGPPRPLTTEGDCQQISAFVPVAADRARAYVPEGFKIPGEDAGLAFVLVTGGTCASWTVDGRARPDFRFGLISVLAHPSENPPGLDAYDLWWQTPERTTHARFRSLGVDFRFVRGIAFRTEPGPIGEPSAATLVVPWRVAPFSMTAEIGPAGHPPVEFPSTHWYQGRLGRVHGAHANTDGVIVPAAVAIEVRAGTPLAELLGGTSFELPGGYLRFHHAAMTRVVEGA
jgi:hypothetical protein